MSRIMLTPNKKQYASIVKAQEGTLVEEHRQFDMKGLSIKKVSTNKKLREQFSDLLENDMLRSPDINIVKILRRYKEMEKDIYKSIMSGSSEYALPAKVNSALSYKDPYTQEAFRGSMIWNKLFPDHEIVPPAKINRIKLKADASSLELFDNNPDFKERFRSVLADSNLTSKDGVVTTIALPSDLDKFPEDLIPVVDTSLQVTTNIKSGLVILKSLNIKTLSVLGQEYPTPIVDF